MVPIPPKYRAYIKAFNGIKAKSIPSPIGLSLVTDHTYFKLISFYKNKNNDPFFCNWQKIEHNFAQTLEYYFPFTGRLVKKENGRYDIAHFDEGALFEVADSADTFSDYSNSNFSYTTVPYDELIPITAFVSLSCPILGIKVTILKDGSFVIGYVINHKLADGNCMTEFIKLFCRISKGETISENEVIFYTDKDREPVKPLAGVDITLVYPRIPFKKRPLPTVPFKGPARRLVFSMSKQNEAQLKNDVLQEAGQQGAKISRFNVFFSLLRKAITKARLLDDEFNGELVCAIGNHYKCKDKNMIKYLGNYAMLAPFPSTVKQVMN
ncbi:unnamed protein product [Mucor hiemalis]